MRQLAGTRTWDLIRERWSKGAVLAFSSAAAIALSTHVVPVYEIYKAGEDSCTGVRASACSTMSGSTWRSCRHWNNAEGGANLDTSHCFMSAERFAELRELLPPSATILGIDEHTSCIIDVNRNTLAARGQGQVRVIREGEERVFERGEEIDLALLGESVRQPHPALA